MRGTILLYSPAVPPIAQLSNLYVRYQRHYPKIFTRTLIFSRQSL